MTYRDQRQNNRGFDAQQANYMKAGHETLLQSVNCGSNTADVYRIFGEHTKTHQSGADTTTMMVRPAAGMCPYFTIPEGTYATVMVFGQQVDYTNSDGTRTPIWPPGFHKKHLCCFSQIRELVTKQTIIFDTPVKNCKTKDDMNVTIDLCIHLRVMGDKTRGEDPYTLLKFTDQLKPGGLAQQLKDAQSEAVRNMARAVTHEQVYALRSLTATSDGMVHFRPIDEDDLNANKPLPSGLQGDLHAAQKTGAALAVPAPAGAGVQMTGVVPVLDPSGATSGASKDDASAPPSSGMHPAADVAASEALHLTAKMMNDLNHQFNPLGVQIIDLQIQDVKLPTHIHAQLQSKTTTDSDIIKQNKNQMFEILKTKNREQIAETELEWDNRREKIVQEGKRNVADWQKRLNGISAETKSQVLVVTEQMKSELAQLVANRERDLTRLNAEAQKILADSKAQTEAKVEQIKAEARKTVQVTQAQARLVREEAKAEATKVIAQAEGKATANFERKRAFELAKSQLEVHSEFSRNRGVFIGGKGAEKGNLLADVLVSKGNQAVMLNVDVGQAKR